MEDEKALGRRRIRCLSSSSTPKVRLRRAVTPRVLGNDRGREPLGHMSVFVLDGLHGLLTCALRLRAVRSPWFYNDIFRFTSLHIESDTPMAGLLVWSACVKTRLFHCIFSSVPSGSSPRLPCAELVEHVSVWMGDFFFLCFFFFLVGRESWLVHLYATLPLAFHSQDIHHT